jgi:acyl carrier protein
LPKAIRDRDAQGGFGDELPEGNEKLGRQSGSGSFAFPWGGGTAMPVQVDGIEDSIRTYICSELGYQPSEISDETPLFTSGMVDSFTFVGMIAHIEKVVGVRMEPESITVENFDSIARIASFLRRSEA